MIHVCGKCQKKFSTEKGYLSHTCASNGLKPTQIEWMGENYKEISESAKERGDSDK